MPRFNLQDKSRGWQLYHKTVIGVTALILLLPIAATVIYAFSSSWGATILPDGLTTRWFEQLLSDPRFMAAMGRSFFICLATLAFSTLLVLPAVFAVFYYFPKLKDLMEILIILTFRDCGNALDSGGHVFHHRGTVHVPIASQRT